MNACPDLDTQALCKAAVLLRTARYGVALTGAGISTPSGIPDFRSPKSGLWTEANAMEVASLYSFRYNPKTFFAWIRPLARLMNQAQPNPAHIALARLEKQGHIKAVITQNVDMLHSRAGTKKLFEVHGNMREATCVQCFRVYPTDGFLEEFIETGDIPHCSHCGGVLKPNVILFGEQLPMKVFRDAQQAARQCDVMLVVGSSLVVAPVSELPLTALNYGAKLIIVNDEETYVDRQASVVIHDDVARVLPCLADMVEGVTE